MRIKVKAEDKKINNRVSMIKFVVLIAKFRSTKVSIILKMIVIRMMKRIYETKSK